MLYFAYGSNMSEARLRKRVPSAVSLGCYILKGHDLRFHKKSKDGSGKCDAYFTAKEDDFIFGRLFEIDPAHKPSLDKAEGLGYGYIEKPVSVVAVSDGSTRNATTYVASKIDETLKPYTWYLNHVLIGANETPLPQNYIKRKIETIDAIEDEDKERDTCERKVHR